MHLWGYIVLHPTTLPISDQITSGIVMVGGYLTTVYSAVLQPTVEDFIFLFEHLD